MRIGYIVLAFKIQVFKIQVNLQVLNLFMLLTTIIYERLIKRIEM